MAYMAVDQRVPETWDDHWLKIRYKDDMSHMGKFMHGQNWGLKGILINHGLPEQQIALKLAGKGASGTFRPTGVFSMAFHFRVDLKGN